VTLREAAEKLAQVEFSGPPPQPSDEFLSLVAKTVPKWGQSLDKDAERKLIEWNEKHELATELITGLDERARSEIARDGDSQYCDAATTWLDAGMQGWTVAYSLAKEMMLALDEEWMDYEQAMGDQNEEDYEPD
jgi:hypothetical protein